MCTTALAVTLLPWLAACGSIKVENEQISPRVPAGAGASVAEVVLDYTAWQSAEPKDVDQARTKEAEWVGFIREGFTKEATSNSLAQGAPSIALQIRIVDLDPGSQTARALVGFGAGTGLVRARVTVPGHGTFDCLGKVSGGWFGGAFSTVLRKLGRDIAAHVATLRG
jgi:hypothetical protein